MILNIDDEIYGFTFVKIVTNNGLYCQNCNKKITKIDKNGYWIIPKHFNVYGVCNNNSTTNSNTINITKSVKKIAAKRPALKVTGGGPQPWTPIPINPPTPTGIKYHLIQPIKQKHNEHGLPKSVAYSKPKYSSKHSYIKVSKFKINYVEIKKVKDIINCVYKVEGKNASNKISICVDQKTHKIIKYNKPVLFYIKKEDAENDLEKYQIQCDIEKNLNIICERKKQFNIKNLCINEIYIKQ